jgi:TIGR03009 family protein
MRRPGLVLTAICLAAGSLVAAPPAPSTPPAPPAQPAPPPPPPADPPADPELDGYLSKWQDKMQAVSALTAQLDRKVKDKTLDVEQQTSGFAKYLKKGSASTAQNLVLMEMTPKGKKDFSERIVCNGAFVYQYSPSTKEIVAHELPKPTDNKQADDNILGFLIGMKKEQVKQRYDLKLTKTDKSFIYVMIYPKFAEDKQDFKRAQMVLDKETFFPYRLWFEKPNDDEVTWYVHDVLSGPDAKIDQREFDQPALPDKDWKIVTAPKNAEPPRIYRPKDGN